MMRAPGASAALICILLSPAAAVTCSGAAGSTPLDSNFGLASTAGFCPDGVWRQAPGKPAQLKIFGSFCGAGDAVTGTAQTTPFPAPGNLTLYLAGYPNGNDLNLWIENTATHEKYMVVPQHVPGDAWQRYTFALPRAWIGQPVDLTAADKATAVHGWLAFSEPIRESSTDWGTRDALELLILVLLHTALLALPALAACAWAAGRGIRSPVTLASIALLAVAAAGYAAFWIYLLSPDLGSQYGVDICIGAAIVFTWQYRRLDAGVRQALRALILPACLTGAAALLILSTGFLYEGVTYPLDTPVRRFSHPLPPDNRLPFVFAEDLREGRVAQPMFGDWLSSDRPPLQTGMALAQFPFMRRREFGYTVLSAILQSLWVVGAWSLLDSFQIRRRAAALALGVTLFSGFVFVNTFFVWPKLLAAALLLALTACLHEIEQTGLNVAAPLCWIAGALAAFALLAHGGSAFGLLGMALWVILVGRRSISLRAVANMAAAGAVFYIPWMLYQQAIDPPGNRLLKMHLAGVDKPDPRSSIEALVAAYSASGWAGVLHNKWDNLRTVVGHPLNYWNEWTALLAGAGQPGAGAEHLRGLMFFYFFQALGLLGVGVAALAIGLQTRRRTPEWSAAARFWLLTGCTLLIWALLMFGPGTTVVHQGSYLAVILAFLGSALALWAVTPWLAWIVAGCQVLLSFGLYFDVMREPVPNGPLMEGAALPSMGLLAVAALLANLAVLVRMARD